MKDEVAEIAAGQYRPADRLHSIRQPWLTRVRGVSPTSPRAQFILHPSSFILALCLLWSLGGCGLGNGGGNGLQFGLQASAGQLTVTVLDAHTQRPVSGAVVSIFDSLGRQVGPWLTTGADGTANFPNVPAGGDYLIRARVEGQYAEGISDTTISLNSAASIKTTIKLDPLKSGMGTLAGAVRDAHTREPVEGARAVLDNKPGTAIVTESSGVFVFKNVPLGTHIVAVTKEDYQPLNFRISVTQVGLVTSLGESLNLIPVRQFGIGHTLIADLGNDRVIEVDRRGGIIWSSGPVRQPTSASHLPTGGVLVASAGDDRVLEISASKSVVWSFGGSLLGFGGKLKDPQWISRSKDGRRLLVADQGHDQIVELDGATHQIIWTYQSELSQPRSAVYLDNGNTLIADSGNAQVVEVTRSGQRVWAYSESLVKPTFAQRLANGNTLITDMGSNRVLEVRDNQSTVTSFATGLKLPRTAMRLSSGSTLVADTGNNRVIELSSSYEVLWEYDSVSQPMSAERIN